MANYELALAKEEADRPFDGILSILVQPHQSKNRGRSKCLRALNVRTGHTISMVRIIT